MDKPTIGKMDKPTVDVVCTFEHPSTSLIDSFQVTIEIDFLSAKLVFHGKAPNFSAIIHEETVFPKGSPGDDKTINEAMEDYLRRQILFIYFSVHVHVWRAGGPDAREDLKTICLNKDPEWLMVETDRMHTKLCAGEDEISHRTSKLAAMMKELIEKRVWAIEALRDARKNGMGWDT